MVIICGWCLKYLDEVEDPTRNDSKIILRICKKCYNLELKRIDDYYNERDIELIILLAKWKVKNVNAKKYR